MWKTLVQGEKTMYESFVYFSYSHKNTRDGIFIGHNKS